MDFSVSVSGIRAGLARQDVTANNLANVLMPAFKSSRATQADSQPGGTRIDGIDVLFSQGPLELSEGRFHMAIQGDGFFQVDTPKGLQYTRAGTFDVDALGRLKTPSGHLLSPNMQIPTDATSVTISPDGMISATLPNGATQSVGQIPLARFANPGGLTQVGDNLYAPSANSGTPIVGTPATAPFGSIAFGTLEGSNVDLSTEMVNTIINSALVKANVVAVRAKDEMLGEILDIRG